MQIINVAIDGPAGAGKSTIAKAAAKEMGYLYVDTGALYRAVGLRALREGLEPADEPAIKRMLPETKLSLRHIDGAQRVFLGNEDVSEAIRSPEASMAASAVSAIPAVREFLFDLQIEIAKENSCIMDGRDIGTVVLPKAQVKIFLTASPQVRAQRRYEELRVKGQAVNFEQVLADMLQRDEQDTNRAVAPLKPAQDSVLVDTSEMDLEQSVQAVLRVIREGIEHA